MLVKICKIQELFLNRNFHIAKGLGLVLVRTLSTEASIADYMDQGQQQHQINTFKYGYGAEDDVSLAEPEIQHNLLYL